MIQNVVLEKGFFGMSAATGGLSDDHDVMKFLTHSITDPESKDAQPDVEEQEEIQKRKCIHKVLNDHYFASSGGGNEAKS